MALWGVFDVPWRLPSPCKAFWGPFRPPEALGDLLMLSEVLWASQGLTDFLLLFLIWHIYLLLLHECNKFTIEKEVVDWPCRTAIRNMMMNDQDQAKHTQKIKHTFWPKKNGKIWQISYCDDTHLMPYFINSDCIYKPVVNNVVILIMFPLESVSVCVCHVQFVGSLNTDTNTNTKIMSRCHHRV